MNFTKLDINYGCLEAFRDIFDEKMLATLLIEKYKGGEAFSKRVRIALNIIMNFEKAGGSF